MYAVKMDMVYNIGGRLGIPSVDEDGNLCDIEEMQRLVDSRFRLYKAMIMEMNIIALRQTVLADKYRELGKSLWRVRREAYHGEIQTTVTHNFEKLVLDHGFARVRNVISKIVFALQSTNEDDFEKYDTLVSEYWELMK
jgi:hypothetical protein